MTRSYKFLYFSLILVTFLLGYGLALLFNFNDWHAYLLKWQSHKQSPLPLLRNNPAIKPKFEFYTLLSQNNSFIKPKNNFADKPEISALEKNFKPGNNGVNNTNSTHDLNIKSNQNHNKSLINDKHEFKFKDLNQNKDKSDEKEQNTTKKENIKDYPSPSNAFSKDVYYVQIGSFKNIQEAERMKALLILKGFDVTITNVQTQNALWYRVAIGPFSTRQLAERAKGNVAQNENLTGMIRKITV